MRGKEDTETKTESRMQYKDNFIWDNAYLYYSYYSPSSPTIPLPAVALFVVPAHFLALSVYVNGVFY